MDNSKTILTLLIGLFLGAIIVAIINYIRNNYDITLSF